MIITKIEFNKKNKNRASVFVDGEFFCALQVETILKNRITVGDEIDNNTFENLIDESETIVAFNKCINLISKSFKTQFQIKQYLYQKKFKSSIINSVIEKLKNYDYIDDEKYAKMFVDFKKNSCGKLKLKNELAKKGIDKNIIDKALNEFKSDDNAITNITNKFMKNKQCDLKTKEKLYRHLLSKGFTYDEIKSNVKWESVNEDWD